MSGQTSTERKYSPSIPPEIWRKIFDSATFVPGAFNTDPPDVFAYPAPFCQDDIHLCLRRTRITKCSLVLVCKAWRELATPLLYQAISITDRTSLQQLLRTFLGAPLFAWLSGMPEPPDPIQVSDLFLLTRRLDFALMPERRSECDRSSLLSLLGVLLRLLKNLEILVVRHKDYTPHLFSIDIVYILSSLEDQECRNLRVLDIASMIVIPAVVINMPKRFAKWPLRTLSIQPLYLPVSTGDGILAPSLEVLRVPFRSACKILELGTLPPSVTELAICIDPSFATVIDSGNLGSFGPNITTLEIDHIFVNPIVYRTQFPAVSFFGSPARRIMEACPALRNLIVNIRKLGGVAVFVVYFPPVEKLGIRFQSDYSKFSSDSLFARVRRSMTEKLKVIRVLTQPTRDQLTANSPEVLKNFQKAASEFLGSYGARFEDAFGNDFHPALEEKKEE